MKILRTIALLTIILTLTLSFSYAQQDTVISVAFLTRDKTLWPDYRANKSSLDKLSNFLKRNPESRIFLNVTCASQTTPSENLTTARERLAAIKSQMAQRFSLEKFLHTSKISTAPIAGRADIAIIVVKKPRPETQTIISQSQTKATSDTTAPKPQPVVTTEKTTEPEPVATTEKATEPQQKITIAATLLTPAKKIEPAKEDEEQPIEFTDDEIRTLINQADNFIPVPQFNIPIPEGPRELPQQPKAADAYPNIMSLDPPVTYIKKDISTKAGKKSPRKRK